MQTKIGPNGLAANRASRPLLLPSLPLLPHVVRPPLLLRPKASAGQPGSGTSENDPRIGREDDPTLPQGAPSSSEPQTGLLQRFKNWITSGKLEKEKILSLGMGGFASYGVISNLNYGSALAISWLGFVKATGTSPLWPGQWKPFLGFYAGMWAVQNFVRPLRFALAVALAPAFEKIIGKLSRKTGNRGFAFGLLMLCIAVVTSSTLFGILYLLGGFPPAPAA